MRVENLTYCPDAGPPPTVDDHQHHQVHPGRRRGAPPGDFRHQEEGRGAAPSGVPPPMRHMGVDRRVGDRRRLQRRGRSSSRLPQRRLPRASDPSGSPLL